MKKILLFASALAGLFLAASCQQESLEPVGGNTVTYTVQVPDAIATKAIGDNVAAVTELVYEVYRTEATSATDFSQPETKLYQKKATISAGVATVELELVNNQNFRILFWAQVPGNGVYNTENLKNVALAKSLNANAENYNAFAGADYLKDGDVLTGRTIKLVRPVAQLNIATTAESLKLGEDANGENAQTEVKVKTSYVKVTGLSTSYNVAEGLAADDESVFEYAAMPVDLTEPTITVNSTPYTYLAMNYVGFAAKPSSTVTVDYTIATENVGDITNTISNVPVKANYRTNIIGNLITSTSDYTVTLDAEWDTPENVVSVWDGKTLSQPAFDTTTKTWTINSGAELAWLAAAVNGTLSEVTTKSAETLPSYDGKTHKVALGANIYLGGYEWIPIGVAGKRFEGEFAGNGYIISDFSITKKHGNMPQAALFGNLAGTVVIKNLTVENANVVYSGEGDFYGAALVATAYGNVTIENVTVKDSYISGNNKVAGILAHDGVVSALNIDNCHVLDCKIESLHEADGGNVGGLVGLLQAGITHSISNSSVKNTVINGINSSNTGKRANGEFVACVYGKEKLTVIIEDCEVSKNTFTQNEGVTYVSPYGVFVGGYREDSGLPTVIVDGTEMIAAGLTKVEDTYYVSAASALQMAIERAAEGETVVLTADVEATDGILITDKKFTLDLGGNTYTVTEGANTNNRNFKIDGSSVVTIQNGTMIAAGDYSRGAYGTVRTEGTATVMLKKLKLYNYRGNGLNVNALSGTQVIISDTEVYSQYGGGIESAGGTIELTDVKVEQKGMYTAPYNSMAISVNGGGKVVVNSGTYSTECITAEEANGQGSSHGPWVAGVLNSGGTLIINGGAFSNDNFGDNSLATYARGLLLADTGADIQINGGTFNALAKVIDIQNNLGDASKNPTATISGGVFSADPLTWQGLIKLADGCELKYNDGQYEVVMTPIAKIGVTEYYSLQEAFNVGGEVSLLRDVKLTETVVLEAGKTATLDLNGFNITVPEAVDGISLYAIDNQGVLTLKDAEGTGSITARGILNGYNGNPETAKLTIESGKYVGIDNGGAAIFNGAEFIIKDGEFYGYRTAVNNALATANTTISGGTFGGVYALESGAVISTSYVIYNGAGQLTINNANIVSGWGGIYCAAGKTIINGGNFKPTAWAGYTSHVVFVSSANAEVTINGGVFMMNYAENNKPESGEAVSSYYGGDLTINGGTFYAHFDNVSPVQLSTFSKIKGGTFYNHSGVASQHMWITNYVAEGYELNADGVVVAN